MYYKCDNCEKRFDALSDAHKRSHGGWDCDNCYGEISEITPLKYTVNNELAPEGSVKMCNIIASYSKMVECFGEPLTFLGDAISHEWRIEFEDGVKMFIYWMNNEGNKDLEGNNYWTVGGFSDHTLDHYEEFAMHENRIEHYTKGKGWYGYLE